MTVLSLHKTSLPNKLPVANSAVECLTEQGQTLYRKQYLATGWQQTPEVVRLQARQEVDLLQRLAATQVFRGRLGLLQVVDFDPDLPRLTTAAVSGTNLQDAILDANLRTRRSRLTRALFLAGRWVRRFQTVTAGWTAAATDPTDPGNFLDYCRLRLETLAFLDDPWAAPAKLAQARDWLARKYARVSPSVKRQVWAHCDYGPFNLMWNGECLTPLDFTRATSQDKWQDVTYLIHRLELLPAQFPWKRFPLRLWKSAILRGYGAPEIEQHPYYALLMFRHLLCRLQSLVRQPCVGWKRQLHNAWVRRQVCDHLNRWLKT